MKFSQIEINNFRQYYGNNVVNLEPEKTKNIILIGGRNGYGKTNFLISLVWCLYGEKIAQVDDNFKKEIQKEKNYSNFMQESLNTNAKNDDIKEFNIKLLINELDLPKISNFENDISSIQISRTYNVENPSFNKLIISDVATGKELFSEDDDKINFINDYIIPLDAAKFVFFDAEKISELASLPTKEEGVFLNDALGKILGLDIYEDLIEDLEKYCNDLKKDVASTSLQSAIKNNEKEVEITNSEIEEIELEIAQLKKDISDHKGKINEFELFLNQNNIVQTGENDREKIIEKKEELEKKKIEFENDFIDLSEILPLAILTGKLEEVQEQLQIQNDVNNLGNESNDIRLKIDELIERLLNQPPEPENSSFNFKDKLFYYNKAQTIANELFSENTSVKEELDFEHDLNNADKSIIENTVNLINSQSKDVFRAVFENVNNNQIEIQKIKNTLSKIDTDVVDDYTRETIIKKEEEVRTLELKNQEIGRLLSSQETLVKKNTSLGKEYKSLLQKINVSQANKNKYEKAKEFINILKKFVTEEKIRKRDNLEINILSELKSLLHKLKDEINPNNFITRVTVSILPENNGMKINLFNKEDEEIKKEKLSSGEKQIYISCLIKALIKEAIQDFPIFIDTPLGRLDNEHIKNILLYYYPNLSEQVVILSTNNEITTNRFNEIEKNVAKTYLLVNDGKKTSIKQGYFKSSEA